jgi:DNA (cytosine-5)-methyltransferase 1
VHQPTVIDLFAGVGGLSLGASRAGFKVAAAVELDPIASGTHSHNFPLVAHAITDISKLSGKELLRHANLSNGELDGLIGGPPCQGFSSIGKRDIEDPRNKLLSHFFRLVKETEPRFFVAENVPGINAERNIELLNRSLALIPKHYIVLKPLILKAHEYGAPTKRKRVFFIGFDPARMEELHEEDFLPNGVTPVTVGTALLGLPQIRAGWSSEQQSWRRISPLSDSRFHQLASGIVPSGVGDPRSLERYFDEQKVSGCLGTVHQPETVARFKRLKPGEKDAVYKSIRLDRNDFCPTLRAGTAADRGSFQAVRPIHPSSPRVITPREAARLQGFPDWFVFHPTKWHSFRQIGNSVSPILAEQILSRIYQKAVMVTAKNA